VALRRLTVVALLLGAPAAHAQIDHSRSFTVTAEPGKPGLGDPIILHFRLRLDERDLLTDTVPRPVGELPAGMRILSVEKLRRGGDRRFTGKAVVAFYRPGRREVPAFGVPWVQIVTGHRGVVATEPGAVEIAPTLPAGNPPLRDIREPDPVRGPGLLWALLGAVAAVLAAWLAARRRARPTAPVLEPATPLPPPPPPDPYAVALARLATLAGEWSAHGDVARYYEAVADALRDYLEAAESIPARERTTSELLWSLPSRLAEGGLRRRVQEVLGEADLVKFARLRPDGRQATEHAARARDLLQRWHRAGAVEEELDAVR
jgi:hypothetical protein